MYREIMNEVRANDYDNLSQRAYVPFRRKLSLMVFDGYHRRKRRLASET
jgi:phytoene synthase